MADNYKPVSLPFPSGWTRGDTIGPITVTLTGRSLADCTVSLTFRANDEDGDVLQVCSSVDGSRVGEGSLITLDVDEETATVAPWEPNTAGKVCYDMQFAWPDGNPKVRTPFKGTWELRKDVSR